MIIWINTFGIFVCLVFYCINAPPFRLSKLSRKKVLNIPFSFQQTCEFNNIHFWVFFYLEIKKNFGRKFKKMHRSTISYRFSLFFIDTIIAWIYWCVIFIQFAHMNLAKCNFLFLLEVTWTMNATPFQAFGIQMHRKFLLVFNCFRHTMKCHWMVLIIKCTCNATSKQLFNLYHTHGHIQKITKETQLKSPKGVPFIQTLKHISTSICEYVHAIDGFVLCCSTLYRYFVVSDNCSSSIF